MREIPRNVAGGSKKFAHLPEEARRLRAVGRSPQRCTGRA